MTLVRKISIPFVVIGFVMTFLCGDNLGVVIGGAIAVVVGVAMMVGGE